MTTDPSNRELILNAAEELFAQKGFAATSVREIVRAARVTNPMLYYYFGSKDELFATLLRERFLEFRDELDVALASESDLTETLRRYALLFLQKTLESPTTTRFIYSAFWGPQEGIPLDVIHEMHGVLTEVIVAAMQRAVPDVDESRLLFGLLFFHGTLNNLAGPFMQGWITKVPEPLVDAIVGRVATIIYDDQPVPDGLAELLRTGCADSLNPQVAE